MSNKQLLNEDGLSHRDRQNSLSAQGKFEARKSCGVSQKVEKWSPLCTLRRERCCRKQETRRAQSVRRGSGDSFNYRRF